jgi:gamma-glutamyl-gamma-aminobutyrate hydrolase PuuD
MLLAEQYKRTDWGKRAYYYLALVSQKKGAEEIATFEYLEKYIQQGTPIFGICRGMQSLWVHFNGQLHQDLMIDANSYNHKTNDAEDPFKIMHQATVSTAYAQNLNKGRRMIGVNSRHHQVCSEDNGIPEGLDVFSRCEIDDTVEGFIHKTLPIVAFQHHPEDCYSELAYNMMDELLKTKQSLYK